MVSSHRSFLARRARGRGDPSIATDASGGGRGSATWGVALCGGEAEGKRSRQILGKAGGDRGGGRGGMHDGAGRGARILFAVAMHGHIC